ncbi:MAG: polyphosphate polymerase domain-containing protein [Ruminococcus sp.]|nr:polyphosphate polymerase domain-containing protein [Ruminococcus sp.]
MYASPRYRHELKYEIGTAQYLALRPRLKAVMQPDENVRADGTYLIRSIYFDNFHDKALWERINGTANREKFRIRYYNDDLSHITLEKKAKENTLTCKTFALLTEEECRSLLRGDTAWMLYRADPLISELYVKMKTQLLRPRILVSYIREPYVYAPGNVRITFDREIRTGLFHRTFLEPQVQDIETADSRGMLILEVKYDAFLPEVISHLIQQEGLRQQSFSKYGICRRFG